MNFTVQVGDFLIRITQLKPGDPCELVLSLRVSDQNSPSSVSLKPNILNFKLLNFKLNHSLLARNEEFQMIVA